MINKDDIQWTAAVNQALLLAYKSSNKKQFKKHFINNYLGFGLKKEDIFLEPLKDTTNEFISADRLVWWLNKKLVNYINHGETLSKKLMYSEIVQRIAEDIQKILQDATKGKPLDQSGIESYSIYEIKASLSLIAITFLIRQKISKQIYLDEYEYYMEKWLEKLAYLENSCKSSEHETYVEKIIIDIQSFLKNSH